MVGRAGFLILTLLAMSWNSGTATGSAEIETNPDQAVKAAMGKGSYPWYDGSKDEVKPVYVSAPRTVPIWLAWVMNLIAYIIAVVALIALLVWLWRHYAPTDLSEVPGTPRTRGEPSRIESLPEGMRREFESTDPWEEAILRRDRGDLAGAVVCLFAHQLLTLSRLGLVRLAPGRTGRQLLRSVADADFRALVLPTLRLFEAVYYGHHVPSPEEFAQLWAQAEIFERRVAGGVAA